MAQSRGKNSFILPETNALNPANLEASLSEKTNNRMQKFITLQKFKFYGGRTFQDHHGARLSVRVVGCRKKKKPAISLLLNQKKYTLLSTSSLVHLAEEYKNYPLWLLKRCNESVKRLVRNYQPDCNEAGSAFSPRYYAT